MSEERFDRVETSILARGCFTELVGALIKGAVARVNIPDPDHPGMRIVGYRVPDDTAMLIDRLFELESAEKAYQSRVSNAECEEWMKKRTERRLRETGDT